MAQSAAAAASPLHAMQSSGGSPVSFTSAKPFVSFHSEQVKSQFAVSIVVQEAGLPAALHAAQF